MMQHTALQLNIKLVMLLFLVSLLGLLYGASCLEDACRYKAEMDCSSYSVIPDRFPGSEEDLRSACTNLNQHKECIRDSVRNCTPNDVSHIEESDRLRKNLKDSQKILNVTTEICREDSELHKSFVLDMRCFKGVVETENNGQRCRDYRNNAMNYIRSRVDAKLQGREDARRSFRECLEVLVDMNCLIEKFVESCGLRAKDTAIKIIEIGGSLEDQCPVSIRIDILELLDSLKIVTRKEMHSRQLLETDLFF